MDEYFLQTDVFNRNWNEDCKVDTKLNKFYVNCLFESIDWMIHPPTQNNSY